MGDGMDKERLGKMLLETSEFIRREVPNKSGLFRTEQYDIERNVWTSEMCDPDDLGDFAPFLVWHDLLTGGRRNTDFVRSQLVLMQERLQQKCGMFHPFSDGSSRVSQSSFSPAYPQNHLDLMLGCNMLYVLTGDGVYLKAAKDVCGAIRRHAISRKGFVYGAVIPAFNMYYPRHGYMRHKSVVSGVFIEEFSNLSRLSGDASYLADALKMARAWTGTETFRSMGIVCDQVMPLTGREAQGFCTLGKMNTNFSCGLLRLAEVSGDGEIIEDAKKNMEGLRAFINPDGTFATAVDKKNGKKTDGKANLALNHMAMGTFLDAHSILGGKKYLETAEECMGYWTQSMTDAGLFPFLNEKVEGWNVCDIDTHADMVTVLSRLYIATRKRKYMDALKTAAGAFSLFAEDGVTFKKIDVRTQKRAGNGNELKYLGGFMKGLLSSLTVLSGSKKVKSETLRLLMRDR
jgi:hypothetical protein